MDARSSTDGIPPSHTPISSTPTATSAFGVRAGRFIVEPGGRMNDRTDDSRVIEPQDFMPDYASVGSAAPHVGSPTEQSPVSRIGRFAVHSKEADLHDVIRRNMNANNTSKRGSSLGGGGVQETLNLLTNQVQHLIDRNAFLEAENYRLSKELVHLRGIADPTPARSTAGARSDVF